MTRALPSVTLVISTYNWESALDRVLHSVARQSLLPNEVIVADDGSGPATRAVIERWLPVLKTTLRHVWHEDIGFRLSAIRNRALAATHSDYAVLLDGDMLIHPDFIRSHAEFAIPGAYAQGSRVMLGEPITKRILAGEDVSIGFFTRGIRNRFNTIHAPAFSGLHRGARGPLRRTRGANLAFWMPDARRVNGFNEDLTGWGREDSEFVARLQNTGVRRRNLKFGAVAYHLHHTTRSQASVAANHAVFEHVVRERITRCANGMDKYDVHQVSAARNVV